MTKVKICGITNVEDAEAAIENGADYVGLIFASSKRQIIKESAVRLVKTFPAFKNFVGVFLNGKKREIEELCDYTGINIIQLHGIETPAFCNYFINRGIDVIKVFRVRDAESLDNISAYEKVRKILLDTYVPDQPGGTGKTFNWSILPNIQTIKDKDIFVSGGLNNDNITELLKTYAPFAVDVSSGVESSIAKKSAEKVSNFINQVRKFCHE